MEDILKSLNISSGDGSYIGKIKATKQGIDAINAGNIPSGMNATDATAALKTSQATAAIGGSVAALQGVADIANKSIGMSKIEDTTQQQGRVDDMNNTGKRTYSDFDSLTGAYDSLSDDFNVTADSIRGMTPEQKVGSVFSTALSGAATGLTVGGPWGALAGAVVGLGAGIGGVLSGDAKAKLETERLNADMSRAKKNTEAILGAQAESITNKNFRAGLSNIAEKGGKIQRTKADDIKSYVIKKRSGMKRKSDYVSFPSVTKGKGGTKIKIKSK